MSFLQKFFFNGNEYFVDQEINLLELIQYFNYSNSLFVMEYNHQICEADQWDKILLTPKDRIELITIVGGG